MHKEPEMLCPLCKGSMLQSLASHMADLGHCIVIVKNVPCIRCTQCGEVSYTGAVAERLEHIIDTIETGLTEIAVLNYSDSAA